MENAEADTSAPPGRQIDRRERAAAPRAAALWTLDDLRPTQMSVGFREVEHKRRRWRAQVARLDPELWGRPVPAVLGPGGRAYVLDRHHTLCALKLEGATRVAVAIVSELDQLDRVAFWREMRDRGWCRPIDIHGVRSSFDTIPQRFEDLADDPFRSLASALRRSGAYVKTDGPYSEFGWADHLRRHLTAEQVRQDFSAALTVARRLARASGARSLPGASRARVAATS